MATPLRRTCPPPHDADRPEERGMQRLAQETPQRPQGYLPAMPETLGGEGTH